MKERGFYRIHDMSAQERPRERLLECGAHALSQRELLAIILRNGKRGKSSLDLATDILNRFENSFERLSRATANELCSIPGIGPAKAAELLAVIEFGKRIANQEKPRRFKISSPHDVAAYYARCFGGEEQEKLHILLLNTKNEIISDFTSSVGTLDQAISHPRDIFRRAIRENAKQIVLIHNHPSGDPTPSREDIANTKKLVEAGKIIGIEVLDHLVIGGLDRNTPHFRSLRELGYIE